MNKLFGLLCLCIILTTLMVGCTGTSNGGDSDSPTATPTVADTGSAMDELYKDNTIKGVSAATEAEVGTVLGLTKDEIMSYDIRFSKEGYGVMDVYMIRPYPGYAQSIKKQLETRLDALTREYENYDIYNSAARCENAEIFEQGEYVIMLILDDNQSAKEIINKYIPAK